MISCSRAGRSDRRARRARRAGFQSPLDSTRPSASFGTTLGLSKGWVETEGFEGSGMFGSRDLFYCLDESTPVVTLRGEDVPAFGGEAIEPAPAFAGLFDPLSRDPAALFEPVEQGIQRG